MNVIALIHRFLLFIYWILIAGVTLRIMMKRRTVPSAMSWLLIIYVLPLLGIIVYMLLGEFNLDKRRIKRSKILWVNISKWIEQLKECQWIFTNKTSAVAHSLFQLCKHRQGISGFKIKNMKLFTNSDDSLLAIINDINLAKNNIKIIFYIWQIGGLVNQVSEALISAAQRGVSCHIMLDSAGSLNFFKSSYYVLMKSAGIHIVEALHVSFLRIFFRRMDLRQHRKMVLIDNHIAYTGSMNMVDPRFFKKHASLGQWVDIFARLEGPISIAMDLIFNYDWEIETGEHLYLPLPNINIMPLNQEDAHITQVIASGPGFPEGVIHQSLLTSIYAAHKQLIITTPYLVPSDDLLYAICTAAHRGVSVYLIIPKYNDSILVSWASRVFFSELLEAGVKIYQFEGGLLHTKSVLVDEQLSLIGTVNLDMRSLWLNFEITLVVDNAIFAHDLALVQQNYISSSRLIRATEWSNRPYWHRIIEKLFYFFSPLL